MITPLQWDSIKWNSRRGMREIDLMLEPFIEKHLPKMEEQIVQEYVDFLNCSDLELVRFLLRREVPTNPVHQKIVNIILQCHAQDLQEGSL